MKELYEVHRESGECDHSVAVSLFTDYDEAIRECRLDFDQDFTVYRLFPDGSTFHAFEVAVFNQHGCVVAPRAECLAWGGFGFFKTGWGACADVIRKWDQIVSYDSTILDGALRCKVRFEEALFEWGGGF